MSLHFSANQYQNAFIPHKLASWEISKDFKERPDIKKAHATKIVATDRGHLLPHVPKSAQCPWGSFVGTWDLPKTMAGHPATVRTARTTYAQETLQHLHDNTRWTLDGWAKNCTHSSTVAGKQPARRCRQTDSNCAALAKSGRMIKPSNGIKVMPTTTCAYQTQPYEETAAFNASTSAAPVTTLDPELTTTAYPSCNFCPKTFGGSYSDSQQNVSGTCYGGPSSSYETQQASRSRCSNRALPTEIVAL